jgi:hypothetical protein
MTFKLSEYAKAEQLFIGRALDALSRSRGGLLELIRSEPTSRPGGSRITTDSGETVDFEPGEIASEMSLQCDDIAAGNVGALIATVDHAAEHHHAEMTRWVLGNLERLTEATGNVTDASGKPLFDAVYEMFDKIELTFEEDGSISKGFAWVMHPDTAEKMQQLEAEMTPEQREQLEELIDRKRQDFFASRRRRELS